MEWINELKKGDKVILKKYSNYNYEDIWAIGRVDRITKTLVICVLPEREIYIRKQYGTEKSDTWAHGWKLMEINSKNISALNEYQLLFKARKLVNYFRNDSGFFKLKGESLIRVVVKMDELKTLIESEKDKSK